MSDNSCTDSDIHSDTDSITESVTEWVTVSDWCDGDCNCMDCVTYNYKLHRVSECKSKSNERGTEW